MKVIIDLFYNDVSMPSYSIIFKLKRRCKINLLSLSFVSKIISKSLVIKLLILYFNIKRNVITRYTDWQ